MQAAAVRRSAAAAAGSSQRRSRAGAAQGALPRLRAIGVIHNRPARPGRQHCAAAAVVAVATPAPLGGLDTPGSADGTWRAASLLLGTAALVGGAVAGVGALPGAVPALAQIDGHVLGATIGASFKLSLICCLVGWLLRSKQIPANAAPVLSKVSFSLLIPCMLFSRCSQILSSAPDFRILLTISAFVVLQIVGGAALGAAVAPAVDRLSRGWQFEEDRATGAGGAAGQPSGLRQLVTLACSFGSSFTLPVVFFSSMLPGPAAERALGYLALILLSWSPLLWSAGPLLLRAPKSSSSGGSGGAGSVSALSGSESEGEDAAQRRSALAASPAGTVVRLRAFARKVATPPFLAVVAGAAAGMTPLGRVLVAPSSATAAEMLGPLGAGILRNVVDVVKMLAGGALAGQSVVLAASLLQDSGGAADQAHSSSSSSSGGGGGGVGGFLAAAKRLLLPTSLVEARVLAIVGLTRFLLLPALTLAGVLGLQRWGLLPAAVAADPVLLLVLLAGSVMPTAQNLIVLLQLSARTQPLAPVLARMLLKLYAYSILPVSLWISGWATWLGVQVVC